MAQEILTMLFRTVILYTAVIFLLRLAGKREIGQISIFDLVVAIMIAELAAIPMEDTSKPLINGLIPMTTLIMLEISFSYIALKSRRARGIIEGAPSIVVEKGKIVRPVNQITMAGNFLEMLQDVEAVGSDLKFGMPMGSMMGSPSLKIKGLAVAGK
jgi:uncharacterized membrane protein YcaP (DUF421 family)